MNYHARDFAASSAHSSRSQQRSGPTERVRGFLKHTSQTLGRKNAISQRRNFMLCVLLAFALPVKAQTPIQLSWTPADEFAESFNVWHYADLASPGILFTNTATNSVRFYVEPGAHFFTITASNMWGESAHSPTVNTPGKPIGPYSLKIEKVK